MCEFNSEHQLFTVGTEEVGELEFFALATSKEVDCTICANSHAGHSGVLGPSVTYSGRRVQSQ